MGADIMYSENKNGVKMFTLALAAVITFSALFVYILIENEVFFHRCYYPNCNNLVGNGISYCREHKESGYGYEKDNDNRSLYNYDDYDDDNSDDSFDGGNDYGYDNSTSEKGGTNSFNYDLWSGWSGSSSYDDGYDDVYDGDDYDDERYDSDPDYADGVDDAIEDLIDEGDYDR